MVTFIEEYRSVYGVGPICKVVPIAPSTYYAVKARQADANRCSERAQRDSQLCAAIQQVWDANHQVYGARKVWLQLYCPTRPGFVYAAFVVDAFARRIVSWRVSSAPNTHLVLDALEQAIHDRQPGST